MAVKGLNEDKQFMSVIIGLCFVVNTMLCADIIRR